MKHKMSNKKSTAGFTLIELLVVIAIIGVLSGVVMLSVASARTRARDAKRVGDMKQIISALEQYHVANGYYPTGTASVRSAGGGSKLSDAGTFDGVPNDPVIPNYLPIIPEAPQPQDGSCTAGNSKGDNVYWYEVEDDGTVYTMTFCLGQDAGDWLSGIRTATPDGVQ